MSEMTMIEPIRDEIYFNGRRYISAASAAQLHDFTRDYVALLCRHGKVFGRRIGRNWYVDDQALQTFLVHQAHEKAKRRESLVAERRDEYQEHAEDGDPSEHRAHPKRRTNAHPSRRVGADDIRRVFARALSHKSVETMQNAARVLGSTSAGAADAARSILSSAQSSPHMPVHALSSITETIQRAVALLVAFMLTFGTYALVDGKTAQFAYASMRDSVHALRREWKKADLGGLAVRAQNQVALAAEHPADTFASIAQTLPRAAENIARRLNRGVNELVFAISFPVRLIDRANVAANENAVTVAIKPYARAESRKQKTESIANIGPQTVIRNQTTITNPVVEKVTEIERVVVAGGITEEYLAEELNKLDNKLSSRIYGITSISSPPSSGGIANQVVLAQRIDRLNSVDITDSTFADGTITGTAIRSSTISDTTIAATSLTVGGSSGLATTTISGSLAVSGDVTVSGNATTTNFFATNASTTNATSTYLYATLSQFTNSIIGTLTATIANITGLTATNATTTNATSTTFAAFTPIMAPAYNATSTTATSTFSGGALFSRAPTLAHTFSSWAIGTADANPFNASLVINPASATADSNLIAAAVNGSVKFLVDAEGDVFVNNLTSVGSVTLSTTTASSFTVEGNTTFGDALTDAATINGTLMVTGTTTVGTTRGNLGVGTTTPWGRLSVAGVAGGTEPLFTIATSTAGFSTSTALLIDSNGNVGIGTSSPSQALTVSGNSYISGTLGVGVATPGTSAILQLDSTSRGFLPPRMTTAQKNAIGSPAAGLTIFDSSLAKLNVYNGTAWKNVGSTEIGGEVTSGTQGSVLFIGDGTVLGQDPSNFSYSTSSNRLLVSQASTTRLSAFGTSYFGGTATSTFSSAGILSLVSTGSHTIPYASSTALSVSGTGYFGTASTTNLTVSGINSALIVTNAAGTASAYGGSSCTNQFVRSLNGAGVATCTSVQDEDLNLTDITLADFTNDADFVKWANATSSLWRSTGLISSASSTIGNGAQAGGLTISGGATTTGNAYFAGNVGFGTAVPTTKWSFDTGGSEQYISLKSGATTYAQLGNADGGSGYLSLNAGGTQVFALDSRTNNASWINSYLQIGSNQGSITNYKLDVTGSGSSGYFGVGSSVGTGNLLNVASSGNVGIGTTSPYAKLSVVGQTVAEYFTATSTSLASTFPYASSTALTVSGTGYFGTASTSALTLSGFAQNRIPYLGAAGAVTSSGNLTFDGSTLALTGAQTISSTLGVTGLSTLGGFISTASSTIGAGGQATGLTISGGATTTGFLAITGTSGTTTIASGQGFTIGGSQFVLQQSSGNVGIGSAAPAYKLDVNGTLNTRSVLHFGSNSESAFTSADHPVIYASGAAGASYPFLTAGNLVLQSRTSGGSRDIVFVGNTTPAVHMVIQGSSGNVGIGTTSPTDAKLNVSGNIIAGSYGLISNHASGVGITDYLAVQGDADSDIPGLILANRATNNQRFQLYLDAPNNKITFNNTFSTGAFSDYLFKTASADLLTIKSTGNVGIGTTSPYAKLTAWGTGNLFEAVTNASTTVFLVGQTGATTTNFAISNLANALLATNANGSMIATTTPTATAFYATGSSASQFPYASSTALTVSGTGYFGTASTSALTISGFAANRVPYITTNGSVTNSGNLTFDGTTLTANTLALTNALTVGNGGTGATTLTGLLQGNGTGAITGITGTAGQFAYYNGTNTLLATSTLFLSTASNVGIATTTPTAKLAVQGTDQSASTKSLEVSDSTGAKMLEVFNNGLSVLKNLLVTASSTIGGGTQTTGLTISGGATTTGLLVVQGAGTSTISGNLSVTNFAASTSTLTNLVVSNTSTSTFAGGASFAQINITSTSATSTFANGINTSAGCFSQSGVCLTPTGLNGSLLGTFATSTPGSNVQVVLTGAAGSAPSFSAGVLTLPSNTNYFEVEMWGAGGSGGGGNTTNSTRGTGGGAGGYTRKVISTPSGTYYYTVGAGGAAATAAAGGAAGNAGGNSCFGTNSTACTSPTLQANGGNAGTAGASGAIGGSGGGAASGGDQNITGGESDTKNTDTEVSAGGDSPNGGLGGHSNVGITGGTPGGGGSAGNHTGGATSGAGGPGAFIVRVYTTVSANGTSGGQLIGIYSSSTPGSNVTVNLNGAAGSAPSFSGGTLTLPSNASTMIVHVWGSGGGGGGNGGSNNAGAGGGGSGGYSEELITSPSGTYYYTVGAGGAGGSAGNGGSNGNQTCFGTNSTACTSPNLYANGGVGASGANPGGTGAGAGGDLNLTGMPGDGGSTANGTGKGGSGGTAPYGGGGGIGYYNIAGDPGYAPGGGGGGGAYNGGNTAGGNGAAGGIMIEVYATGLTSGTVGNGTAGQFAFYNTAGTNLTATSSIFVNTTTGNIAIGSSTPGYKLDVAGDVNVSGCFRVAGVCIGYVKSLIGIYATSTPGSNVTVSKGTGGPRFSSGTLTIPATTTEMVVEVWGGGGGGGGADNTGTPYTGAGGGGGGGYSQELIVAPGSTYYYTVGAGGAKGTAGSDTAGSAGGQSCFGTNATACTSPALSAAGGNGAEAASAGGAGGAGSGGDINMTGGYGGNGANNDSTYGTFAVNGGNAPRGGKGGGNGGDGTAFGGGGSGSSNAGAGGNGGAGGIVITFYATSSPTAAGNDYAEMFPVSNPGINAGDIVAVDLTSPVSMKLAEGADSGRLAGVIATQPGHVLGDINAPGMRPVALMGRVPVKVNLENGPIKIGDRITPSGEAGVGKKATIFDSTVGIAIANFPDDPSTSSGQAATPEPTAEGTVMIFVTLDNPPPLKMVSEGLLESSMDTSGFDFVQDLLAAIQSRITSSRSALAISGQSTSTPSTSSLAAIRSFNSVYNPMIELRSQSSSSSALTLQTASTSKALLDYLAIVPSLAGAIGELDERTAKLSIASAFGTSTALWIDAEGNVSIGRAPESATSTFAHRLTVAGDVGASAFIVTGWESASSTEFASSILDTLSAIDVFAIETEDASTTRLSIDINALPDGLRAGGGIDLSQLGLYNLAGLKALSGKVNELASTTLALDLNLQAIASTSASSTPESESFAQSFFTSLFDRFSNAFESATTTEAQTPEQSFVSSLFARITQWFADATNGIGDFFANRIKTKELCVSDENGETCITKQQLDALIAGAAGSTPSTDSGQASSPQATPATSSPPSTPSSPSTPAESSDQPGGDASRSDTEAPVITILGNNPATISVGDTYNDLGATVAHDVDTNLGIKIFVDGEEVQAVSIDTSIAGEYTIKYEATDSDGNVGSATRIVKVIDPNVAEASEEGSDEPAEAPPTEEPPAEESPEEEPPAEEPQQ